MNALTGLALPPRQIGLFLDVDGTLLDLAATPDSVEVPPGLRTGLAAVERRLDGALALVSGRPIAELDQLFAPLVLPASGVHGAEIRRSVNAPSQCLPGTRLPDRAWHDLLRLIETFPGAFAENKRVGFAVHHRAEGAAVAELAALLRDFAARLAPFELELSAGHRVFEMRPARFDKGTAIRSFMADGRFAGRRPVFIADDRMDEAGFTAALTLGGLAFSVGTALPGLSGWFARPAAVRAWLERLVA